MLSRFAAELYFFTNINEYLIAFLPDLWHDIGKEHKEVPIWNKPLEIELQKTGND